MPQPNKVTALAEADESTLPEDLRPYFQKCRDKLGCVPNVLRAWLLRPEKLRNFIRAYDEADAGAVGPVEARAGDDRGGGVGLEPVLLLPRGAWGGGAEAVGRSAARRDDGIQLPGRGFHARQRGMLDFALKLTAAPYEVGEADREGLRATGFSDADIFDICEVTGFFNYTNRVAHGVDMIPNVEYHTLAREPVAAVASRARKGRPSPRPSPGGRGSGLRLGTG